MAFWDRLKRGLSKSRDNLQESLQPVLESLDRMDPTVPEIPAEAYDALEEALLAADVGVEASQGLLDRVREAKPRDRSELEGVLETAVREAVAANGRDAGGGAGEKPRVVLVVGVNGSGKTTLIGKLASRERGLGRTAMLVAADTFRAAAIEQLQVWAERSGAEFVAQRAGADPAAVAHDGVTAAHARAIDTVFIDTAGRLHTDRNLMQELQKVKRVIERLEPGAPHEVLLVLDGSLGQNSFAQARRFHEALGVTAVAMNKLDGTARGGVVVAVVRELGLPVRWIGVGEGLEDLDAFEPADFARALVRG